MLKKPADFERAINDLEFENQQYVKQIEIENQRIEALEKATEDLQCELKLGNDSVHQLEDDIKHYHRQFTHNRFSIESHRSTLEMLTKHEEALVSKKELILKRYTMLREERHGYIEHYKAILKDYEEKYADFKHNQILSKKKAEAEELEEKLKALLETKSQLKEQCEKVKGKEDLPFTCINAYMLKVAELYMRMHHEEAVLEDLVKKCSSMEIMKTQERQQIEELQKNIQEQKTKNDEKKKMQELKQQEELEKKRREEEQQKHMEEEKRREVAIRRKEEMAQLSQQAKQSLKITPDQSQPQRQSSFVLKMPQRPSVSSSQRPQLQISQPKKSRLQESAPIAAPRSLQNRSAASKIPLLQSPMMPSFSPQPQLLRQVQEKQMQKQMALKHLPPKSQQSQMPQQAFQVCPPSPILKPPSTPAVSVPQLFTPRSIARPAPPSVPQTLQKVSAVSSISTAAFMTSRSSSVTSSSTASPLQRQEPASQSSAAVVSAASSPIMCPVPATPHRPSPATKPRTPLNMRSPVTELGTVSPSGSEASAGSPFDVDKQLAKMRMLAAKSPGAIDWDMRPMFEDNDEIDDQDGRESTNNPATSTSMFDSASTFLTTPFDLFGAGGGGGDGGGCKNMFASPEKPGGKRKEKTQDFSFNAPGPQGDSSPFCLNFGGGGGENDMGGGGDSTNNFMAMFGGGDEQEASSDGDTFTFNFGSSVTTSESSSNHFSLF